LRVRVLRRVFSLSAAVITSIYPTINVSLKKSKFFLSKSKKMLDKLKIL
jgi:hypothetical protein